ncbi:Uncharacterised protein [Vibrio cholerae]|nr:Uncharacterised protein [Vibrio cholerae]CSB53735.1 Uncharacterised protein [Vibrio cholerae]CSC16501.1 Uncharacterised protein [Vibrio cholerae]CSI52424.1 Uncharacterised protein [Vibrio cholerae]CSI82113.1 Uncharacterised protein [Vibrio cholerae]
MSRSRCSLRVIRYFCRRYRHLMHCRRELLQLLQLLRHGTGRLMRTQYRLLGTMHDFRANPF